MDEPSPQPATAHELAGVCLRGRDVACPGCGYNRRDGVTAACPECSRVLSMGLDAVEMRQRHRKQLRAALAGLSIAHLAMLIADGVVLISFLGDLADIVVYITFSNAAALLTIALTYIVGPIALLLSFVGFLAHTGKESEEPPDGSFSTGAFVVGAIAQLLGWLVAFQIFLFWA